MTNNLKGYYWWQELNELNDNIDHKNVVLTYVCRWIKIYFLRACIKEDDVLKFLILEGV